MCGILFIIDPKLDINKANQSLNLIKNRGPDGIHKIILNNTIYIGQTILSITGQIQKENFVFKDNYIAYNGEIYNYKSLINTFPEQLTNCQTDTQVLIQLSSFLGVEHTNDLIDGMYAYVFFNHQTNTIKMSRDMQGEKGLYYYLDANILIACSTITPIIKYLDDKNIQPSRQELRNYFYTRHLMSNNRTIYSEIKQLQPGETLTLQTFLSSEFKTIKTSKTIKIISRNIKNITTLVQPEISQQILNLTSSETISQFEKIFKKCIYQMIPDVPYASIVSGGVDSSLITAYLVNSDKPPDLLVSVCCPGKDQISCDLSAFETSLGRKIDIVKITPDQYAQQIQVCQNIFASPVNTHSAVSLSILAKYVQKKGIKVMFTGEGADELFGGYECYREFINNYSQNKTFEFCPSNYTKRVNLDINFLNNNTEELDNELKYYWNQANEMYQKSTMVPKQTAVPKQTMFQKHSMVQSQLLTDSLLEMTSVGFRSGDLMCQMYGVEPRTPFTCREVMRWALNLPLIHKIDSDTTKKILKQLYLKFYPKCSLFPKQGFTGYPNESKVILPANLKIFNFLGVKNIITISNLIKTKPNNSGERNLQWKLINTELFLQNL